MKKKGVFFITLIIAVFCAFGFAACDNPAAATVPSAPQNFTATAGNKEAVLTWTAPSSDGGARLLRATKLQTTTGLLRQTKRQTN